MKLAVGSTYLLLVEQVWNEHQYEFMATVKDDGVEVYRSELYRDEKSATRDGLRWLNANIGR